MKKWKLSDFDYYLPEELIAQEPLEKRDESRLLILDKKSGKIKHEVFKNLPEYLDDSFIIVRNSSKVVPARLFGRKESGAMVEVLLIEKLSSNLNKTIYKALGKPLRRLHIGQKVFFSDILEAKVLSKKDEELTLEFTHEGAFEEILHKLGKMPLPKYIKKELKDPDRYQTIYAKTGESAAAPTAGLHFTEELFEKIKNKGVKVYDINLNVGLGTFAPVRTEDLSKHKMHEEKFWIEKEVAEQINKEKSKGKKVLAIGTTTLRALESASNEKGILNSGVFSTDLFITPGYKFKIVDALITNFHLPKSTLIMLVSAFAGYKNTMEAYKTAVQEKYRFFSFGDAMLIL